MDLKIYVWKKLDRPFDYMNVERWGFKDYLWVYYNFKCHNLSILIEIFLNIVGHFPVFSKKLLNIISLLNRVINMNIQYVTLL